MNPNFNDEGHSVSIGAFKSEIDNDDVAANSYEIDQLVLVLDMAFLLVMILELMRA